MTRSSGRQTAAAKEEPSPTAEPINEDGSPSFKAGVKRLKEFFARFVIRCAELSILPLEKRSQHEGTRAPVFVLEAVTLEVVATNIPRSFQLNSDGEFVQTIDDAGNSFEFFKKWSKGEMQRRFPEAFQEIWRFSESGAWLSREEAEMFAAENPGRFPLGFRARAIAANGLLEELIQLT